MQEDEDAYKKQFSQYIKNNITPDMGRWVTELTLPYERTQSMRRRLRRKLKRRGGTIPKCLLSRRKTSIQSLSGIRGLNHCSDSYCRGSYSRHNRNSDGSRDSKISPKVPGEQCPLPQGVEERERV
ncbi:hypothetical protein MC885_007674, partial [Smutsia gigantea]